MGNMCCRREVYAPNGTETDQSRCGHQQQSVHQQHISKQQPQQHPAMSSAYHSAGDDCAINELLEGRMDLDVLMPDGRQVRLTVERRTPMMDLLVQAASATKISPGGHVIHVFGDGDKGNGALQYKPSTPIGSLDPKTICIVPKKEASDTFARKIGKTANRPFEPTFRVQVHLPRNQLTVLRVSPRIKIADLKSMVCKEKGLDTSRYQLIRPSGPAQPLAGDMTIAEYGSTELTLLSNSSIESHICNSTSHIIPYPKRAEENKRKNGILRLLTEDAINKVNEASNCSSALRIDVHEKINKQEDAHVHQHRYKPKKRRPAPPPPPPVLPEAPSHSRQSSSDSSGYHEATSSFLHEEHSSEEKASSDSSGVSSLDAKVSAVQSSPPPIPNSKKKKAPAPPPPSRHKEKPIHRQAPTCPQLSKKINSIAPKDSEKVNVPVEKSALYSETAVEANLSDPQTNAIVCNNFIVSPKDSLKDPAVDSLKVSAADSLKEPVVLLQTGESEMNNIDCTPVLTKGPTPITEFTISTYSATSRDTDPITRAFSENNLVPEDCPPTQENNEIVVEDRILTTVDHIIPANHIIPADHVIPKDPVPKRNMDSEKKLDLPHLWESEGHQLHSPPLVTLAAKALPAANTPTTDPAKEREIGCETPLAVTGNKGTTSLVPDTCRHRTSVRKAEEDQLTYKGEAVSTRVALVALNARIEQDVTQQEIASSIQAAFHSVDFSPQPSLLAIKQRNSEDSASRSEKQAFESPLPKTTTVRVPLVASSEEIQDEPPKVLNHEREALLIDEDPLPPPPATTGYAPSSSLRRSSSLLSFTDTTPRNAPLANSRRARQLQQSLTDLSTDGQKDFEAEQQRLQREYLKLQRQFLIWQKQVMNSHAMLREECIVPQYARTLRQSHSLPEGEDSFEETTPSVPLVSRSLSYEPTKERCSTLPRSAINITSLEFGSIPLSNGTSTLRSSKTKSYFKPPQVRASTKSRQRLPPEIKREGDVDISDDTKMLTTILPSFESLKLITENHDEEIHSGVSRLRQTVTKSVNNTPSTPADGRKVPIVHLSSTFPKLKSRLNNGDKTADRDLKHVNGDTSGLQADCSPKASEQSPKSEPHPPPPPPMPANSGVSKYNVVENCTKPTVQRNGVGKKEFTPHVDPREQLMLEIRKFGGRTALRKISLASY